MKAPRPQKHSDKLNPNNEKTLRDEFAMAAMPVLLMAALEEDMPSADADEISTFAYNQADAMLEARK